jgi:hypothetical protein
MQHSEPSLINQLQRYRPPCVKCGAMTSLARIEPAPEPGYDLRTFECIACGHSDTAKVAYP